MLRHYRRRPARAKEHATPDKGLAEDIAAKRDWELRRAAVHGARALHVPDGARIGVSTRLEWPQVDLLQRTATIGRDKNGDPHVVHLTTEMIAALANLPKTGRKVFGYASRHAVYGTIKRVCERAGLPYLATHQPGRHSFATGMIVRNNVDVATTAKIGNWRSPRVLLENYVHAEREGEVVDRVFGTPATQRRRKALK